MKMMAKQGISDYLQTLAARPNAESAPAVERLAPNLYAVSNCCTCHEYEQQESIWSGPEELTAEALRNIRNYGYSFQQHLYYQKRAINDSVHDGATVLDIGFSNNPRLHYLALTRGTMGIGVDISLANCRAQAAVGTYLKDGTIYLRANAADIPLPDASVDVIIATDILEHLQAQDKKKIFATAARLLKKNGRLIIKSPLETDIPFSLNAVLAALTPKAYWREREAVGHYRDNAFGKRELLARATEQGLRVVSFTHFNFLLEKIFDYHLLPLLRRRLVTGRQGKAEAKKQPALPLPPTVAELTAPRLRHRDLLLKVARMLLLWPDRVAAALGWGNHVLVIFER